MSATDEEPLRCYQCRVERNEDCTDKYLRECPTDQAYDVCMVSVINNGTVEHLSFLLVQLLSVHLLILRIYIIISLCLAGSLEPI